MLRHFSVFKHEFAEVLLLWPLLEDSFLKNLLSTKVTTKYYPPTSPPTTPAPYSLANSANNVVNSTNPQASARLIAAVRVTI